MGPDGAGTDDDQDTSNIAATRLSGELVAIFSRRRVTSYPED